MARHLTMDLYLDHMKKQYVGADRKTKTRLLDELCKLGGYHRKYAIELLSERAPNVFNRKNKGKRGPRKTYQPDALLAPLKQIWFATDQMCGKRLKSAMPLWLPFYDSTYGTLDNDVKSQLLAMSSATIDRLLEPTRNQYPKRMCGTKPGSLLKKHIPISTDQWNETRPGFFEADTVAHCGQSLMGDFVWSITLTDICTAWTENRAVWGKGARDVLDKIEDIEQYLPFEILGFDSDNGSEFLNHHLIRYFAERPAPVQFTRSRPYHSDDNAHVEQKNWTHVRQLFGYYRIENHAVLELMNDVYRNECSLLRNYFYPTSKLQDKKRVNTKMKKIHEKQPKTPYQRVMESEHINQEIKKKLTNTKKTLNPFELKKSLELKLKNIFAQLDLQLRGRNVAM
jgi:hypothetical protein